MPTNTFTNNPHPPQTKATTKCPYVFLNHPEGFHPLVFTDRTSLRIFETVRREIRAYMRIVSHERIIAFQSTSNPIYNWYQKVLSNVYIPCFHLSMSHPNANTPLYSFALPLVFFESHSMDKDCQIHFSPPALWSSIIYDNHNDNHEDFEDISDALLWIIPYGRQSHFGTLIFDAHKKGFQKLLPPKAFFD